MFIRRNMSSNVSYQQLKEYPSFKQLAKVVDVLVLKQILPMVVKKVSVDVTKQLPNNGKMMYIPEELGENSSLGLNGTMRNFNASTKMKKFFMIETKIYNILKYLFYKKIQCMDHLKSFEKLNFFYRSNLDQVMFGGYVYRKQDKIDSIYYLVRGQIKISRTIDERQVNICNIFEGTFFGIYEFQRNKVKRLLNAQSCSNNTIVLTISLDMITEIFGKEEDEILKKILKLPSEIPKIKLQEQRQSFQSTSQKQSSNQFIKAYEFQRRITKFSDQRSIDRTDTAFGKFIQNKSLLFKIKDSNDSIPKIKQENPKITTNFHKSESVVRYYSRLNQHRLFNLGKSVIRTKQDKQNQNQKGAFLKPSQVLSSRLKQRFNCSKQYFSNNFMQEANSGRKTSTW